MKTEKSERTETIRYRGYQPNATPSKSPPPPPPNQGSAVSRPQKSSEKK